MSYHESIVDIDECGDGSSDCSNGCINTPGGFYCDCDPGYKMIFNNCEGRQKFIFIFNRT